MREILFRGKRADNGEWVCSGNLIQFFDNNIREVYISQYGERCNAVHDIDTDNIETITCKNGARFYKVIPETVGQYTGLTDKNGTKIFDGDIVIWRFSPCIVKWDAINACYSLYQNGKTKISGFNADTMKLFEVIGNIHDNPDLIKQED